MNGCTIRYIASDRSYNTTTAGKIVDRINGDYIIHTPNPITKSIRFDSDNSDGLVYRQGNRQDDGISEIDVIGFRWWKSDYEININFWECESKKSSKRSYNIDFYGCVSHGYIDFSGDVLDLKINDNDISIMINKNDISVSYNSKLCEKKNNKNELNLSGEVINVCINEPIEDLVLNDMDYSEKINNDIYKIL